MLLFIVVVIIASGFGFLFFKTDFDHGGTPFVCFLLIAAVMLFCMIEENVGAQGSLAQYQQQREILQYQVDNGFYTNFIDNGKESLYDKVTSYNKSVVTGQALNNSIWVGAFYGDYYDELELVRLP